MRFDDQAKAIGGDPGTLEVTNHDLLSRKRVERRQGKRPFKMAQTSWVLDADTHQPVCFTTGCGFRKF